jgi:AcrR family transcriptional regulator
VARARPRTRRTQEERREGTIRKLVDAATDTLIESGYAGASVQPICARAGVSQGALFRHFATREALMVAVGEDVGARILARYRRQFLAQKAKEADPLLLAARLLRASCRSRLNLAWYELAMAARTSPTLRKALAPAATRYEAAIGELAHQLLPDLAAKMGPAFPVLVDTIVSIFDGEAIHRFLWKRPQLEEARIELLRALVSPLVGSAAHAT